MSLTQSLFLKTKGQNVFIVQQILPGLNETFTCGSIMHLLMLKHKKKKNIVT